MRTIILLLLSWFLCFVMAGCGKETSRQQNTQSQILDTYFEAFNNHDIQSLAATVADDIRLMSITPDTVTVDLTGKEDLKAWLTEYFSNLPNVQSTYSEVTMREPFVTFVETASWGPDSARKQQSSLATYQIKEDKIHRVWYYYPE